MWLALGWDGAGVAALQAGDTAGESVGSGEVAVLPPPPHHLIGASSGKKTVLPKQ